MAQKYNKERNEEGILLQDMAVLQLLLQAKSRHEISRELCQPLGTVNTACTRIYKALSCKNLPELLLRYRKEEKQE